MITKHNNYNLDIQEKPQRKSSDDKRENGSPKDSLKKFAMEFSNAIVNIHSDNEDNSNPNSKYKEANENKFWHNRSSYIVNGKTNTDTNSDNTTATTATADEVIPKIQYDKATTADIVPDTKLGTKTEQALTLYGLGNNNPSQTITTAEGKIEPPANPHLFLKNVNSKTRHVGIVLDYATNELFTNPSIKIDSATPLKKFIASGGGVAGKASDILSIYENYLNLMDTSILKHSTIDPSKKIISDKDGLAGAKATNLSEKFYSVTDLLIGFTPATGGANLLKGVIVIGHFSMADDIKQLTAKVLEDTVYRGDKLISKAYAKKELVSIDKEIRSLEKENKRIRYELSQLKDARVQIRRTRAKSGNNAQLTRDHTLISIKRDHLHMQTDYNNDQIAYLKNKKSELLHLTNKLDDSSSNMKEHNSNLAALEPHYKTFNERQRVIDEGGVEALVKELKEAANGKDFMALLETRGKSLGLMDHDLVVLRGILKDKDGSFKKRKPSIHIVFEAELRLGNSRIATKSRSDSYSIIYNNILADIQQQNTFDGKQIKVSRIAATEFALKIGNQRNQDILGPLQKYQNINPTEFTKIGEASNDAAMVELKEAYDASVNMTDEISAFLINVHPETIENKKNRIRELDKMIEEDYKDIRLDPDNYVEFQRTIFSKVNARNRLKKEIYEAEAAQREHAVFKTEYAELVNKDVNNMEEVQKQ